MTAPMQRCCHCRATRNRWARSGPNKGDSLNRRDIKSSSSGGSEGAIAKAGYLDVMSSRHSPKRFVAKPTVFVLEIDQRPILAFEATSAREAQELAKEDWLLADLKRLRSNGEPLWNGKTRLRIGPAVGEQVAEVKSKIESATDDGELAIVYLVPLDRA
jgi:hypothetical protein